MTDNTSSLCTDIEVSHMEAGTSNKCWSEEKGNLIQGQIILQKWVFPLNIKKKN